MFVICCLTSAYHAGYALSTTRLLKTKRSIIISDFWFDGFFLLVIDVIKPPGTYFNNNIDCRISLKFRSSFPATSVLLYAPLDPVREISPTNIARKLGSPTRYLHKNVIDLCWILYNKPRMVATFFLQRTNSFILFLIVPSLQISCFRKTKEKQYAKYDLNKRIAARLI